MEYKLIRAKRKTISVSIKGGEVTVKAPNSIDIERIEKFVSSKQAWIDKKLAEYGKKASALAPILDYSHALYFGEVVPITVTDGVKKVKFECGEIRVPVKYAGAAIKSAVANFYKRTAKQALGHMLEAISIRTGLKYASFALTNAAGNWGSCDGACNIRLNWRLVMLEDALSEYVIIHELCHTLHHDHSKAFWAEVGKLYPAVAAAKKKLKFYSELMRLYR